MDKFILNTWFIIDLQGLIGCHKINQLYFAVLKLLL